MVLGWEPEVTEEAEVDGRDQSCWRFPETLSTKCNQFLYRPPLSPTAPRASIPVGMMCSVQLMVNIDM